MMILDINGKLVPPSLIEELRISRIDTADYGIFAIGYSMEWEYDLREYRNRETSYLLALYPTREAAEKALSKFIAKVGRKLSDIIEGS